MPEFRPGETVLLFLQPANLEEDGTISAADALAGEFGGPVFRVTGLAQGKYAVAPDGTASRAGFTVAGRKDGMDNTLPLAELVAKIRSLAKACGKHPA
jgi:hypothetical protein